VGREVRGLAQVVFVTDPSDERIAVFREVRERDIAGRLNGFIAEGEVVVRSLAASRLYRPSSLLIAERRLAKLAALIADLPAQTTVYGASQTVMEAVAGFAIHRGILAFGLRPATPAPEALLAGCEASALIVALFGVSNHDNMGGIFRNAAAFGAAGILLDPACCDPLYRKAIRVSAGAALRLPFARFAAGQDAVGAMLAQGFTPLALSPWGATPLRDLARPPRVAVLLGAEGPGLADDILARARTIAIPMAGGTDSLNVATTSGIVLHHLTGAAVVSPARGGL